jgi:4-methoxybenzoate monooxygenase (O-demethylating)
MTAQAPGGVPVSALDPFSDEFLADPFRWHPELREAGPVVWLERYGTWAMARYAEVHEALRDYATFCSSAGVGLSDFRKEKPWRPPSLLLEADPPEHSGHARRCPTHCPRAPCATCAMTSPGKLPG